MQVYQTNMAIMHVAAVLERFAAPDPPARPIGFCPTPPLEESRQQPIANCLPLSTFRILSEFGQGGVYLIGTPPCAPHAGRWNLPHGENRLKPHLQR